MLLPALLACATAHAQLSLPPRAADAAGGRAFARRITGLEAGERERAVLDEVLRGNVPESWRWFVPVDVTRTIAGRERTVTLRVAPDYVTVGSEEDGLRVPLGPASAQALGDALDCILPTPRMADGVHAAADVKLAPAPLPAGPEMVTVAAFVRHDALIDAALTGDRPHGLVAGHKKDVVLTPRPMEKPDRVAIYGWHRPGGEPIQPLYSGHAATWVDYSHGVRLVRREALLDGEPTTVDALLADPELCTLLSGDGPIASARYGSQPESSERLETLDLGPGVRAIAQIPEGLDPSRPVHLVLYALPNGSTIEQTLGRRTHPGEDWRFGIQHVGAQVRWLRERALERNLVVVYLEADGLAWPAWRRAHDPRGERAARIVAALRRRFGKDLPPRITLTGHSGGGALTFAYLDALAQLPDDIERIAFLDSNYGYDADLGHGRKLAEWLRSSDEHALTCMAYHDSVALLNGETFVSEEGGTWGRSRAMLADLTREFPFEASTQDGLRRHVALGGRLQLLLRENPERAILHTVQVEKNGVVHALLAGTGREEVGYRYLGPAVYGPWIAVAPVRDSLDEPGDAPDDRNGK